jgi:hypothetical protein
MRIGAFSLLAPTVASAGAAAGTPRGMSQHALASYALLAIAALVTLLWHLPGG